MKKATQKLTARAVARIRKARDIADRFIYVKDNGDPSMPVAIVFLGGRSFHIFADGSAR